VDASTVYVAICGVGARNLKALRTVEEVLRGGLSLNAHTGAVTLETVACAAATGAGQHRRRTFATQ